MTIKGLNIIFPEAIINNEGKKLKEYLSETDFGYMATVKRCIDRLDSARIDKAEKKLIVKALKLIVNQILRRNIPPYLLERNLPTCTFDALSNSGIQIIDSDMPSYAFYSVPNNRVLYDSENAFQNLVYGLERVASSYTDEEDIYLSGVGIEEKELDYINNGITTLLAYEALRIRDSTVPMEYVKGLHQKYDIPIEDVIACYYTANSDRYIDTFHKHLKKKGKILNKTEENGELL